MKNQISGATGNFGQPVCSDKKIGQAFIYKRLI